MSSKGVWLNSGASCYAAITMSGMGKSGCGSGLVLAHEKLVRREETRYDVKYKRIPKTTDSKFEAYSPSHKTILHLQPPSPPIYHYLRRLPTHNKRPHHK